MLSAVYFNAVLSAVVRIVGHYDTQHTNTQHNNTQYIDTQRNNK
jgi:hypothetical protein